MSHHSMCCSFVSSLETLSVVQYNLVRLGHSNKALWH